MNNPENGIGFISFYLTYLHQWGHILKLITLEHCVGNCCINQLLGEVGCYSKEDTPR